MLVATLD